MRELTTDSVKHIVFVYCLVGIHRFVVLCGLLWAYFLITMLCNDFNGVIILKLILTFL